MGARDLRRSIAILAAAVLLAAPGESYGDGPGERPGPSEASPVADNAAVQDIPADDSPLPFPDTADLSSSPDNAAAQDNTAASPAPLPGGADDRAPADASAVEEAEIREPSFGGESPAPEVSDPIEPVNRGIFHVNDKLYRWVFKP
ncbi:MAG: hypothetical protein ACXW4K_11870, partial [Candidatus Deferrimicrobiaceae bacterium]